MKATFYITYLFSLIFLTQINHAMQPDSRLSSVNALVEIQQGLIADLKAIASAHPTSSEVLDQPVDLVKKFAAESDELKKCLEKVMASYSLIITTNSSPSAIAVDSFNANKKTLEEKRNSLYENYLLKKRSEIKQLVNHPNFQVLIHFTAIAKKEIDNNEQFAISKGLQDVIVPFHCMIKKHQKMIW